MAWYQRQLEMNLGRLLRERNCTRRFQIRDGQVRARRIGQANVLLLKVVCGIKPHSHGYCGTDGWALESRGERWLARKAKAYGVYLLRYRHLSSLAQLHHQPPTAPTSMAGANYMGGKRFDWACCLLTLSELKAQRIEMRYVRRQEMLWVVHKNDIL